MAFQPNVNLPDDINQIRKPYKGVVIENKDPLMLRRVKVKVEGVLEGVDAKNMPWAAPASGQSSGRRADTGCYNVPDINSIVQITFPNGDIYSPQYADWTDEVTDGKITKLFDEDYPYTKGQIEPDGSWERENEKQGYKEYYHRSEYYIQVDKEGNLIINIPKNLTVYIGGNACIQVEDLISILGNNNLGINIANQIGMECGDTFGVKSGGALSLQAPHIHLNDGRVFGTAEAAKSVLKMAIQKLKQRLQQVNLLRQLIKAKGIAARQAIQEYAEALKGNKKS